MFSANDNRLWLDAVEGFVAAISIVVVSLYPVWHSLRGMFGLSLLFYGDHFSTLAFHIVVFRISGWKKVRILMFAHLAKPNGRCLPGLLPEVDEG